MTKAIKLNSKLLDIDFNKKIMWSVDGLLLDLICNKISKEKINKLTIVEDTEENFEKYHNKLFNPTKHSESNH
jgi:hypothetical protein